MTKNAEYILEIINSSKMHLTAEQIYLALKEKNVGYYVGGSDRKASKTD